MKIFTPPTNLPSELTELLEHFGAKWDSLSGSYHFRMCFNVSVDGSLFLDKTLSFQALFEMLCKMERISERAFAENHDLIISREAQHALREGN